MAEDAETGNENNEARDKQSDVDRGNILIIPRESRIPRSNTNLKMKETDGKSTNMKKQQQHGTKRGRRKGTAGRWVEGGGHRYNAVT